MSLEQIVIAIIVLIVGIAVGMYLAKRMASSPESMRADAYGAILEAVTLAKKLNDSAPAEMAAAAAQKAHGESVIASLKDAVAQL